jgi:hypothetical protein
MRFRAALMSCLTILSIPGFAVADPLTGTLGPAYGSPIVVQATQTNSADFGDNSLGQVDQANGSELDAAYGYIAAGTLHLFVAGNLAMMRSGTPSNDILVMFLDTVPGGVNPVSGTGMSYMNGLHFDSGFAADWAFDFQGNAADGTFSASKAILPNVGGTAVYLGKGTAGGPGTLSGGTNPWPIRVAIDNHNVAGVTLGCGAASGAGVVTGVDWEIPLAAIGNSA